MNFIKRALCFIIKTMHTDRHYVIVATVSKCLSNQYHKTIYGYL